MPKEVEILVARKAPAYIRPDSHWQTPQGKLEAVVDRGRSRNGRLTAGSYISDLAELKKAINLCKTCQPKFNVAGSGYYKYREVTGFDHCNARCDDCRHLTECNTFLSNSLK